jgi:hypothetical protein
MYEWLDVNAANERKATDTDDQFYYKARKRALGAFKKDIMSLPEAARDAIAAELEARFEFLFKQLGAVNNRNIVDRFVTLKRVIVRKRKAEGVHLDGEGDD